MPGILDVLKGIGRGAGQGLGVALTPVAMAMAARSGRNPFTAMPGYSEPMDPLQQARLNELQSQQAFQQAMLARLPQLGGGQQGMSRAEQLLAAVPSAQPSGLAPAQPQPQGVGGMVRGMANDALAARQARQPQGQGTMQFGGQDYIPVPSISPRGTVGLSFQPAPAPIRLPAGTKAISPTTGQPLAPGERIGGRQVIETTQPEPMQIRARNALFEKAAKQVDAVKKEAKSLGEYGTVSARARSLATGIGLNDPEWRHWQTSTDLLATMLMNAHVGARGSEGIMTHFIDTLIGANFQSSANVGAALAAAQEYLNRVDKKHQDPDEVAVDMMSRVGAATPVGPQAPTGRTLTPSPRQDFRSLFGNAAGIVSRAIGGPVAPMQTALVGENGPELQTMPVPSYITPLAEVQQAQMNRIGRAQNAGAPMQIAALGANATGRASSPTTTLPPQGYGQGQGLTPEQLQQVQGSQGTPTITFDAKGRPVVLTPARQ